jgi:hypothetical protein
VLAELKRSNLADAGNEVSILDKVERVEFIT